MIHLRSRKQNIAARIRFRKMVYCNLTNICRNEFGYCKALKYKLKGDICPHIMLSFESLKHMPARGGQTLTMRRYNEATQTKET